MNEATPAITVIPAIDLIGGRCVRLRQGSYSDATLYDGDPLDVAHRFASAGARRIHLVDLDAARSAGHNRDTIERIRRALTCTLEVGGGVRDCEALDRLLDIGVDYAILGTVLARDPEAVARWAAGACRASRMLASVDARDGLVRVEGWQEGSEIPAGKLARQAAQMGLAGVEYTNIARDGMLTGPDIEGTREIARAAGIPVILSGGIARTEDTEAIVKGGGGMIEGFIVGRALYEGSFDLAGAIEIARGTRA